MFSILGPGEPRGRSDWDCWSVSTRILSRCDLGLIAMFSFLKVALVYRSLKSSYAGFSILKFLASGRTVLFLLWCDGSVAVPKGLSLPKATVSAL